MYSPPAPRPSLSILGFLSKLTKDSAVSSGKGMVWLVSLEVILYQLIHVVSPTSKEMKESGIEFRRSAFSHCFSWVPRRAEGLYVHIVLGKISPESKGEWAGRWNREGRGVMWGCAVELDTSKGNWQVCRTLSLRSLHLGVVGWGEGGKLSTVFSAIGRVFAQGAFLLLLLWVVCTWMRPLYRVKKEALGQEVRAHMPDRSWVWSRCSSLKLARATQSWDRVRAGGSAAVHTECLG